MLDKRERIRWLIWFAMVNGVLSSAISFYNVPLDLILSGDWSGIFLPLALPGHLILMSLLLALGAYPLFILLCPRLAVALITLIYSVFIIIVFTDTKVFTLYRFHLNSMVWNMLLGGALREIVAFSTTLWWLISLLCAALVGTEVLLAFVLYKQATTRGLYRTRYLLLSTGLVIVSGQLMYAWSNAVGYTPVTSQLRYIPWAQPLTVRRFLKRYGFKVTDTDQVKLNPDQPGALDYPKAELQCSAHNPLNIMMLLIDSVRFDMLTQEVMPNSWALSRKSLNFLNHYSSGNATRFGVFGLMYGLPGSYWHTVLGEQRGSVFIKQLVQQNYDLQLYGSASLSSPEFDRTIFADVRNRLQKPASAGTASGRDQAIVDSFIESVHQHKLREPFFGFIFLDAPHAFSHPEEMKLPFLPELKSVNYLNLDNDFDPQPFLNLYKNAIYFDDGLVGKLLTVLATEGYLNRTIIVLTSDHGKEFNELKQNYWGHNSNFSVYQVKVPLVIYWPGRDFAEYSHRTAHVDLVPTLLKQVLGCINSYSDYSTGTNLFEEQANRALLVDSWSGRAILTPSQTMVFDNRGDLQLYDDHYRSLPGQEPDNRLIMDALETMHRFYRK
jgi:membrane-anchored protein YejM (alkaline phosphatase superfamily)